MIVDPDFLDHWRTRMVVDALDGDEMAPVYIVRLWAHCQVRKSDRFEMPPAGLKAQCRFKGDAEKFEQALTEAGFVTREGNEIHILGWAAQNASLIAAWENGSKGGRPKTKPEQNPDETHGLPSANPSATQTEPIRVDKSREDKKEPNSKATTSAAPKYSPVDDLAAHGVDPQIASDWLAVRKAKKAASTKTAIDGVLKNIRKANLTPDAALRICCERGWAGFESEWLKGNPIRGSPSAPAKGQSLLDRLNGKRNEPPDIIDIN